MAIGTNTGIKSAGTLGPWKPTPASTEALRIFLLGKNLQSSYLADGNPVPPPFGVQQPGNEIISQTVEQSVINQETVESSGEYWKGVSFLDNRYGPAGGYKDILTINTNKLFTETHLEYVTPNTLQPIGFTLSCYGTYELYTGQNTIVGSDSPLMLAALPILQLNLSENQTFNISDNENGNNISISPGLTYLKGEDYLNRLSGNYDGTSEISGQYQNLPFVPDINQLKLNGVNYAGVTDNITATVNAISSYFNNGNNIPQNDLSVPNPSDNFITHMGVQQQQSLFQDNLVYNQYRPDYSRVQLDPSVTNVTPYYYVGSKSTEPSNIESPSNATPTDKFGRKTKSLVYGPGAVAKELETVNGVALWKKYNFGLEGKAYTDGGGLAGGFTWFGSTSLASVNAPSGMLYSRSFNKPKRVGGILDQTQKLIDSAPLMGGAKRKHAGHAIDQTSKIFNDGYKNISKGSGAKFIDKGIFGGVGPTEFCRTWTKDNPYYKFSNLQKSEGLLRGNPDSVLSNTYNLNIAPNMGQNVDTDGVKKYMFSIENLAWRGAPELDSLPASEKGPNGGRVMWFPPYDINVGDTNSAQWNSVSFLGRPEPIYTYNYTERIGTLSFKIVVDHSSIMDVIASKELEKVPDTTADAILESFIVGCQKFDIYELAEKYGNLLSAVDLEVIQNSVEIPDNSIVNQMVNDGDTISSDQSVAAPINSDQSDGVSLDNDTGTATTPAPSTVANNFYKKAVGGSVNAKRLIANLMKEENYFKHLEENEEFVYDSLKRQLKYFHPSFHSMTPEGLNNRLSFLLQCTRPGRTIPTETEGGSQDIDAENTAFGAPPICVLRLGDFYHTKIAIDSVSFSYEPLIFDLNPEGIGVQPMIANVSMNFKYIGGQGLEKPVSELQNALSNNFFANTEVYNENSVTDTKLVLQSENAQAAVLDGITQANSIFIDEFDNLNNVDGQTSGELN
jgi:hypothetical protein